MPVNFEKTSIQDLYIINNSIFSDERGYNIKYFERDLFIEMGITAEFREAAEIISKKGTLRGLHYQKKPSQARLIHVVSGSIFNAALDLRAASETFGKYECFYLNNEKSVFIPEDFASGFLAMNDNTIITCLFSGNYIAEKCDGIIYNDTDLNIPWPLEKLNAPVIISEKDMAYKSFNQYNKSKYF